MCDISVQSVCVVSFFLFFFFSSRRRHTRLVSDWSSDVCSSDLLGGLRIGRRRRRPRAEDDHLADLRDGKARVRWERSEERRVGKECRSRGSPEHYKKKKRVERALD